jgi:lycopene cyclase domain-containing protein
MRFAYGAALLVALAGMLVLDRRFRLAWFAAPRRAALVLGVGLAFFLVWDVSGIGTGVFFVGDGPYQSGLRVAPEVPVEELGFLLLLGQTTLCLAAAVERLLAVRRARTGAGAHADGARTAHGGTGAAR